MRTSRVSRETSQLLNALSPGRRRSTRSSANARTSEVNGDGEQDQDKTNGAESGPSNPHTASSMTSGALGKRKREAAFASATPKKEATPASRTSPRKTPTTTTTHRKPSRQPAKHIKGPNGTLKVQPPPNWESVYNTTATMRKRLLAPVDTMGCESLAEAHRSPQDQRLQTLVSLMLSSQTKDTVTAAAMKNLQEGLEGGFCLSSLLAVQPEELNRLIEKVGFHNNKTKFIKSVAVILRDEYNGDIPDTVEGLISLPGVGPKMAYLCMSAAWGRDEGIGVDVHVHRITNLWGWHKTSTPEQTRAELEDWLPREKWHEINHLLVGFGQTVCLPVGRKCGDCDLAAQHLCPSAEVKKASPVKRRKKEVEIKVEKGEVEDVKVVKDVVVQADDAGIKVELGHADEGQIELQGFGSPPPDTVRDP